MQKTIQQLFYAMLLATCLMSCKDNPTASTPSLEDRINAAKPISSVTITYSGSGSEFFIRGTTLLDFTDAYAQNGILNVFLSYGAARYFNLSQAKEVFISVNDVTIVY
jgi:hypothetical protein